MTPGQNIIRVKILSDTGTNIQNPQKFILKHINKIKSINYLIIDFICPYTINIF